MQRILVIIFAFFCVLSRAQAQDRPTIGFVYNTSEANSLQYECSNRSDGDIDCEFLQSSVRKKAKAEDLQGILAKRREEFRSGSGRMDKKECSQMEAMFSAIKSGVPTAEMNAEEFKRGLQKLNPDQKADVLKAFEPLINYCKSQTEQNYLEIATAEHKKNTKTCLVSSFKFKQRLRRVDADNWSVVDNPNGACGIVNVSRLARGKGEAKSLWSYYSKKVITNPNGELPLLGQCSQLDQKEYVFDWRSQEHQLGCEYISLSIL